MKRVILIMCCLILCFGFSSCGLLGKIVNGYIYTQAENEVKEGNMRAVKGLAVAYILGHPEMMEGADCWYAYAEVSPSGDVSNLRVSTDRTEAWGTEYTGGQDGIKDEDGNYIIYIIIQGVSEITSSPIS